MSHYAEMSYAADKIFHTLRQCRNSLPSLWGTDNALILCCAL